MIADFRDLDMIFGISLCFARAFFGQGKKIRHGFTDLHGFICESVAIKISNCTSASYYLGKS